MPKQLKPLNSCSQGFSLIELMIAIAISLFVLLGLTTLVVNDLKANRDAVKIVRLNQDIRASVDFITRDVRRANYDSSIQGQIGTSSTLQLANTISLQSNKLTYSYGGTTRIISLSGNALMLQEGASAAAAAAATMQPLTDPSVVTISTLSFCYVDTNNDSDITNDTCGTTLDTEYSVAVSGSANTIKIQPIRITVTGALKSDSSVTKTLVNTIRVRNDAFTS